jgi:hypothetical protein
MWTLRNKPTTVRVTAKLAGEFAGMDPAPRDRPLSERRLQVYERLLRQGTFRPVTWARAWCKETEGWYRVNGKHTSRLLSGLDELPEFFVTVEDYDCDTLEDVAKLYGTFDSKMQSRTVQDINLSFAAAVPELAGLPVRTIGLAVAGMHFHLQGGLRSGRDLSQPVERAELLLEHSDFVLWLDGVFREGLNHDGRSTSKHLQRQPVVAAMFGTWQKARAASTGFWQAVRDETGATPTLPDRTLARYLMTHGVEGAGVPRSRKADRKEFYVKCIHAWNAWRRGATTDLKYFPDKKVPAIA